MCHSISVVQLAEEDTVRADRRQIVGELQIVLVGFIAGIPEVHIERCPGNLSAHIGRWFPRVGVFACQLGFRVAGLLVLGVAGVAIVVNLVRPRRVHTGICRLQVVQIGVGRATLVDAVGVAPEMLTVPATRCAEVGYGF